MKEKWPKEYDNGGKFSYKLWLDALTARVPRTKWLKVSKDCDIDGKFSYEPQMVRFDETHTPWPMVSTFMTRRRHEDTVAIDRLD